MSTIKKVTDGCRCRNFNFAPPCLRRNKNKEEKLCTICKTSVRQFFEEIPAGNITLTPPSKRVWSNDECEKFEDLCYDRFLHAEELMLACEGLVAYFGQSQYFVGVRQKSHISEQNSKIDDTYEFFPLCYIEGQDATNVMERSLITLARNSDVFPAIVNSDDVGHHCGGPDSKHVVYMAISKDPEKLLDDHPRNNASPLNGQSRNNASNEPEETRSVTLQPWHIGALLDLWQYNSPFNEKTIAAFVFFKMIYESENL